MPEAIQYRSRNFAKFSRISLEIANLRVASQGRMKRSENWEPSITRPYTAAATYAHWITSLLCTSTLFYPRFTQWWPDTDNRTTKLCTWTLWTLPITMVTQNAHERQHLNQAEMRDHYKSCNRLRYFKLQGTSNLLEHPSSLLNRYPRKP